MLGVSRSWGTNGIESNQPATVRPSHSDSTVYKKIRNVWNTFIDLIQGIFEKRCPRLMNRGRMMDDSFTVPILQNILPDQSDYGLVIDHIVNTTVNSQNKDEFWNKIISQLKEYPSLYENKKMIFVPFVVQGNGFCALPHIVLMTIDTTNKKIEYFDSKGKPADEFAITEKFNVGHLLNEGPDRMKAHFKSDENWTVDEEIVPEEEQQKNTYACGYEVIVKVAKKVGAPGDYSNPDRRQTVINNNRWEAESTTNQVSQTPSESLDLDFDFDNP